MHIRTVETFPLFYKLPVPYGDANGIKFYRSSYWIRITTDSGVQGWGECADWLPTLHTGFQERIIPCLIGQPVSERNRLVQTITKWHSRAGSAVSMALTEIMASAAGLNVCDLWGGKLRKSIPVYASFQSYSEESDWQNRSLKAIETAVADGFDRIKVKIGGKAVSEDQCHIRCVQGLLQGKTGLALDANQSYDAAAALAWQSLLETWPNLMWVEEPMPMKHASEYALLRQKLSAPVAGGENMRSASDFLPLLTQNALDFLTPDPLHETGIDGYRETLKLARSFGIRVTPHSYDGALSRLYAIFAQACLEPWSKMKSEPIEPVEWDAMDNLFSKAIPLQPRQGDIAVPDGRGIGLEVDVELLRFYQWDGSSYG